MNDITQETPQEGGTESENRLSVSQTPPTPDTYSYRGWLNSDKLYKRALAVLGYGMIGQLIVGVMISVFMLALILLTIVV